MFSGLNFISDEGMAGFLVKPHKRLQNAEVSVQILLQRFTPGTYQLTAIQMEDADGFGTTVTIPLRHTIAVANADFTR
jgi:hypothetical protein